MSLPIPPLPIPTRVNPRIPKSLPIIEQHPPYSLIFDGVAGYGSVPDSPSLRGMTGLSIAVWWKAKAWTPQYYGIISKWGGGEGSQYLLGYPASGNLWWMWGWDDDALTTPLPSIGVWHYIVAIFQGSTFAKIYIDGLQKATTNSVTIPSIANVQTAPLQVARYASYYGNGQVAGALLYNRVLSPAEIWFNMQNPMTPILNGLVLFLPFIEGSGLSVKDYSGQNNNAALNATEVQWNSLALDEMLADVL